MNGSSGGPNHPIVVAPLSSRLFELPAGVELVEPEDGSPGATHPEGFLAAGVVAGLKDSGKPDMGVLVVAPEWRHKATSACVSTTNAFAAAPVVLNRTECDQQHLVAVVLNSGNANACTGEPGLVVARAMQAACAGELGVPANQVAVASTGIIGVQLPADIVTNGAVLAAQAVKADGGPEFNRSIMTTDRFAKICAVTVETSAGAIRLGVCGKGAGMIAPAMATMLCVVTTDAQIAPDDVQALLDKAVETSFNRITVDGEMSTNDSVWFLANGASGIAPVGADLDLVGRALEAMLRRVALMMVADGEGATKVMRLRVTGAEDDVSAAKVARAIGNSPLVKTAMNGGDPNWGRIISSAGAAMAGRSLPGARLQLAGVIVVQGGAGCEVSASGREKMTAGVRQPEVEIDLDLGLGEASTELYFADMGHEYITINAEYHT